MDSQDRLEHHPFAEAGVIRLDLTREEREIMVDVLDTFLSDLRMEIANTDRQDFRDMLKKRKAVLLKVLDRMV
ncbi:MAG: hypothetical protein GXP52_09935 [Deltaproteobacteria bacterium]|nr:hypothetical protein [Deltaproteobacteria bacterium]